MRAYKYLACALIGAYIYGAVGQATNNTASAFAAAVSPLAGTSTGNGTDDLTGLRFIATWPEMISAMGANPGTAVTYLEGIGSKDIRLKRPFFDPAEYREQSSGAYSLCAANADPDICAAKYYINTGFNLGEYWSDLAGLLYIASYSDLKSAFDVDVDKGISHYQDNRLTLGRTISFNVVDWILANPLTVARLDDTFEAATRYYIGNGSTRWTDTQTFRIFGNNLCLSPTGWDVMTNGKGVNAWQCVGNPAQVWTVRSDGTIRSAVNSTRCLQSSLAVVGVGSPLEMGTCTGAANQLWDASDIRQISTSDKVLCIDTANSTVSAQQRLVLAQCDSDLPSQWWHMRQ